MESAKPDTVETKIIWTIAVIIGVSAVSSPCSSSRSGDMPTIDASSVVFAIGVLGLRKDVFYAC